ncbi:MAG: 4Fe-4S dicluster domain-containing protein [Deltaproteobacteria bacterium]|nr:4Fe-4S dicluster domain-containing protein [Deltaproteobacteria bacterium]
MGISRRDALHILYSGAISTVIFTFFKVSGARALPRPPGALIEPEFLKYCTRCYQCIDVCPTDALIPAGISGGIPNIGTPVLDWKKCIFCMACIRTCPTGAIKRISKDDIKIGNAVINRETCLTWSGQSKCDICYNACPYDAIKLENDGNPIVLDDPCNGCGACERKCPTDPKSIVVYYDKVKRFLPPEHRFALRIEEEEGRSHREEEFKTWFVERIKKLGRQYGIIKEEEETPEQEES